MQKGKRTLLQAKHRRLTYHRAQRLNFCIMKPVASIAVFSLLINIAGLPFSANGQTRVKPMVSDVLQTTTPAELTGFIAGKLDAAYQNRILTQDANRLVQPFLNRTEA